MPRLTTLLFDVDGTLAETEEVHREAFNKAFEQAGLDWHWSPSLYAELLAVTGGKERIRYFLDTRLPGFETPISLDQKATVLDDKRVRIEATVPNTEELRAWLRSYGDLVEVVEPEELRQEMVETVGRLLKRYRLGDE